MNNFFSRFLFKSLQKDLTPQVPFEGKVEVFSRHCLFSSISYKKKRIAGFSKEKCYQNIIQTIDRRKANITFFLDIANGHKEGHYLSHEDVIEYEEGTEGGSFLQMLDYVMKQDLHPDTICYFVEDDYIHRPLWVDILQEGFSIANVDYVTLYDHNDKYFYPMYRSLQSRIFSTPSCHWRTTPSTTQTFAARFKTLKRDYLIHRKYSENKKVSLDHAKFLHLGKRGSVLISSIPGWSTHAEPEYASPSIDWEFLLTSNMSEL